MVRKCWCRSLVGKKCHAYKSKLFLFVYLIKGSSIRKAAFPNLIHRLRCLVVVFAKRSTKQGQGCSSPYALLVLVRQLPYPVLEEFIGKAAFATQGRSPDFRTGRMFEIRIPIQLEPQMVVRVYHFFRS